jgi:hypothetical protein
MVLSKYISQRQQYLWIVIFAVISIVFFTTCSEDTLKLGPNVLPDDEMLDAEVDSLPVELYTIGTDAVETKSLTTSLLGSVNDPVMGTFEAEFFTDFIYSEEPTFMDETDLDSIVVLDLYVDLVYYRLLTYGKFLNFRFNVYELLEPMPQYGKSDFVVLPNMYDPDPLNVRNEEIDRTFDTLYQADVEYDTFRVFLKNSYAQRFLDTALINDEIYHSQNQRAFKNIFKGFYFSVEPGLSNGGSIIMLDQSATTMTFRTLEWNADSTKWDTVSNLFSLGNLSSSIDSGGAHLNIFRSTLSPEVANVLNDTINPQNKAYIQSLTGPQVFVKLPALSAFRSEVGSSISVNRAQLILPIDMGIYRDDHELYTPPIRLGLLDGVSKDPLLDDLLAENGLLGYMDTTYSDNFRYILNIGNHLQEYLRDESSDLSNSFFLFAAGTDTKNSVQYLRDRAERVVLNGNTSVNKPFVRITYSKIPH